MGNRKKKESFQLSWRLIEDLYRQNVTGREIDIAFGRTRAARSYHKVNYGTPTKRQEVLKHFPFSDIPAKFQSMSPCRNLRNAMEFMATDGVDMFEDPLSRLRGFYKKIRDENIVVEYDPDIPPIKGVSSKGGWAYRERLPEDGNLLIRVNKYVDDTRLGKEGRWLLQLPPESEWP